MGHSVFNHIDAVQEANRLADVEAFRETLDYKNWRKPTKKSSKAQEVSPYVPANILYFQKFAEDLFDPSNPDPRGMIADHREFLTHIGFAGEDDGDNEEVMDTFFEF
jgi:hypothetical protein